MIAMSAGNHAQAVAYHAGRLGIPATIVMPKPTPFVKIAATRSFGADGHPGGRDARRLRGRRCTASSRETGAVLVHPYDDPLDHPRPGHDRARGDRRPAGPRRAARAGRRRRPDLRHRDRGEGAQARRRGDRRRDRALPLDAARRCAARRRKIGGETLAEGIAVKNVGKLTLPIVAAVRRRRGAGQARARSSGRSPTT